MSFGEVLKEQRKIAGLTQVKLAKDSGVSRTYLSDVENDRYQPSVNFIKKVTSGLAKSRELPQTEEKLLYNLLAVEAGYGSKPIDMFGFMRDSLGKNINSLNVSQLTGEQVTLLGETFDFFLKYNNISEESSIEPILVIGVILKQLNAMYDTYTDENLSIEEKKEGIEFYLDDLKTDEAVQNLFDDIADYFISELENNPS